MLFKKTFICLSILLILANAETLPGLDYIKSGYDGTKLLNDQLGQSKYPIFDLSPQNGENDFSVNGQTYKVPIMVQATQVSLRKESQCEGIYYSFSDFQKKYSESISFSAGLGIENFSISVGINHELDKFHEEISQNNKAVSVSQSYWAMYSLTTAPAFLMPLNPMFKQSLEALNRMAKQPTTDTQQTIYNQVINSFGTHYVSSAIMGGSAKIYTTLDQNYLKTVDIEQTKTQIGINFSYNVFQFKFGFNSTDLAQKLDENFKKNSDDVIIFSPEVDHIQDPKAWATWESTVPQKPQPVNTTVSYISDLAYEYPEVQAHLRKTIDFYLKNGRLPTIGEVLNFQVALQEATQFIPGADIVGCGFDATSLSDKRCIFDLEGENYQWSNPNDPSIEFNVPEMLFVMNKPESITLNGTTIFSTFNDFVKETFWETREDSHGFLGFGGKHKKTQYHEFYEKIYQNYQKLALNLRQITWYTLKVPTFPKPPLNKIFEQSIKMLPAEFNEQTSQIFNQFIEAFGTHVVIEGDFGGLVYAEDWFESCLLNMHDEIWIREEISRRYDPFGCFRKDSTKQTDVKQISVEFKQNSEFHALLLGGTDSIPLSDWDKWVPSVKYNPKALNRKLVPLTNFVPNGPQKDALSAAILAIRQQSASEQESYISYLQQIAPPPKPICSLQAKIPSFLEK
ncbi:hypothetical protein ABPG73_008208 [Tetrahymena malaccensis]